MDYSNSEREKVPELNSVSHNWIINVGWFCFFAAFIIFSTGLYLDLYTYPVNIIIVASVELLAILGALIFLFAGRVPS